MCAATSKGKGEKSYIVGTTSEIGILLKTVINFKYDQKYSKTVMFIIKSMEFIF